MLSHLQGKFFKRFMRYENFLPFILAAVSCVFLYRYFLNYTYTFISSHNSDTVAPIVWAADIIGGNPLLKDWIGTTRNFFVEIYVFYILPILVFGPSKDILLYLPPFIYTLIVFFSFMLVYKKEDGRINWFGLFTVTALLGFIWNRDYAYAVLLTAIHNEMYLCVIAFLSLIKYIGYGNAFRRGALIFLAFVLSFIAMANPFALYVFFIPMAAVLVCRIFFGKMPLKQAPFWSAFFIGSVSGRLFETLLEKAGGIVYDAPEVRFVNMENWWVNLQATAKGLILSFQGDFFDKTPVQAAPFLIDFFIMLLIAAAVAYAFKRFAEKDITEQFLSMSILILLFSYMFSKILRLDIIHGMLRYFVFIHIAGAILLAKTDMWKKLYKSKRQKIAVYTALTVLFAAHVCYNFKPFVSKNKIPVSPPRLRRLSPKTV